MLRVSEYSSEEDYNINYQLAIGTLKQIYGSKNSILVLIDLGGSILFRTDERDCTKSCDYKFKRYQYYFRPGYE